MSIADKSRPIDSQDLYFMIHFDQWYGSIQLFTVSPKA